MNTKIRAAHFFVGAVTLLVVVPLIVAITKIGSPATERAKKVDQTRINALMNMQYAVQNYYATLGKLPTDFDTLLSIENNPYLQVTDPETAQRYEYKTTSPTQYQLCATFTQSDENLNTNGKRIPTQPYYPGYIDWQHPQGYYCFTINTLPIDKTHIPFAPTPAIVPAPTN